MVWWKAVSKTPTCRRPGKSSPAIRDAGEIGRIVERPQRDALLDHGHHLPRDGYRPRELRAAMHHPVSDAEQPVGQPALPAAGPPPPEALPRGRRSGSGRDDFLPSRFQSSVASVLPSRWAMPLMSSRELPGSITANLAEEEPQLRTRTFMVVELSIAARAITDGVDAARSSGTIDLFGPGWRDGVRLGGYASDGAVGPARYAGCVPSSRSGDTSNGSAGWVSKG